MGALTEMTSTGLRESCTLLLPVRNGEIYLKQSIDNLLQMSKAEDEILVINDGSTDSTADILEEFLRKDLSIVVVNLPPVGLVAALNKGVDLASNEFVARVDVDDIYSINRLDLQVHLLQSNPKAGAVFSDYSFWSDERANLGYMASAVTALGTELSLVDAFRTPHPSVTFRRSAVKSVGGYRAEDFPAEDLGLWIRLSSKYELVSVPSLLLRYRMNPSGVSGTRQIEMKTKRDELLAILDHTELLRKNFLSYADFKNAYRGLSHQNERLALHNFDLYICIQRAKIKSRIKLIFLLKLCMRFLNLGVLIALIGLLISRWRRNREK